MHTYFAKMMNLLPIMYVPAVILYLIFFRDYVDPISLWVSICDIVTPTWPKI